MQVLGVFIAASFHFIAFWDTSFRIVDEYQCFDEKFCFHLQDLFRLWRRSQHAPPEHYTQSTVKFKSQKTRSARNAVENFGLHSFKLLMRVMYSLKLETVLMEATSLCSVALGPAVNQLHPSLLLAVKHALRYKSQIIRVLSEFIYDPEGQGRFVRSGDV
jgi:hypothetical protein